MTNNEDRMTFTCFNGRARLYIAAAIANFAFLSAGSVTKWTSPTLAELGKQDSWLHLTVEEGSWVVSLMMLGATFGPLTAAPLLQHFGIKATLLVDSGLYLISWDILAIAAFHNHVGYLYAGRFISGMATGITYMAVPIYVSEIAEDDLRGTLCSLIQFFLSCGFLLQDSVGPFVSYSHLLAINSVASLLFLVLFSYMPESPHFLLRTFQKEEAIAVLTWLRGSNSVMREVEQIEESVNESMSKSDGIQTLLSIRGNRKALLLSCGLMFFQQLSGINAMLAYTVTIFQLTSTLVSPIISSIIISAMFLLSSIFTPLLTKCWGVRLTMILSSIGGTVSQAAMSFYFYHVTKEEREYTLWWLPVTSATFFISFFAIGIGPLPWAVMGELFPTNVKAISTSIVAAFSWALGFLVTKFFADLDTVLGPEFVFMIFSLCLLIGTLFIVFLLPDTSGLSLQDIQDLLNCRSIEKKNAEL